MSVSTKELFTAFFKGLAFAKGLNFGEKNRGMAEDRWITIHPGGDPDVNRRIEIDDETGEIEKGLGAGTNIKDLSKTLKAKRKGEEKTESEKKTEEKSEKKIKVKMSKGEIDFTKEEAKKQLDTEKNDLEELQTENKDLKEKKKAADKEKVGVDALLKFYKDYVGTLNKFEEDSNLNASRYYEKYKDRFTDLTGKELKQVKNDNRLDANMAQRNLDTLTEKEKDLFKKSYTYRNRIEQNDGLIKYHKENIKGITDALKREDMAQDSLDNFIDTVTIE